MLRVTEEKERNFEKRGYMGKKVLGIMVILLFFTGCQNMGNESENLQQVEKQENGEERNSSISNDETSTSVFSLAVRPKLMRLLTCLTKNGMSLKNV